MTCICIPDDMASMLIGFSDRSDSDDDLSEFVGNFFPQIDVLASQNSGVVNCEQDEIPKAKPDVNISPSFPTGRYSSSASVAEFSSIWTAIKIVRPADFSIAVACCRFVQYPYFISFDRRT